MLKFPRYDRPSFSAGYVSCLASVAFFTIAWWAWDNLLLWVAE